MTFHCILSICTLSSSTAFLNRRSWSVETACLSHSEHCFNTASLWMVKWTLIISSQPSRKKLKIVIYSSFYIPAGGLRSCSNMAYLTVWTWRSALYSALLAFSKGTCHNSKQMLTQKKLLTFPSPVPWILS